MQSHGADPGIVGAVGHQDEEETYHAEEDGNHENYGEVNDLLHLTTDELHVLVFHAEDARDTAVYVELGLLLLQVAAPVLFQAGHPRNIGQEWEVAVGASFLLQQQLPIVVKGPLVVPLQLLVCLHYVIAGGAECEKQSAVQPEQPSSAHEDEEQKKEND